MRNLVRKSDFARLTNVSRTRVGQWVKARQIDGAAIVGTGRAATIDADLALEQLNLRLDTDQRYGLKGLSTKLDRSPADADADDIAYVERHRGVMVDLADVEGAVDDIWVRSDIKVQEALEPFPEALGAYMAIRHRLAAVKDCVVKA
jgi:hypothetical protein